MVASSYNSSSAFDKGLPRLDEEDSHCQHSCPRSVLEYALHNKKRSELLHFLMFQSTNVDITFLILFHLTSPHLGFPLPYDPLYLSNSIHTFLPSFLIPSFSRSIIHSYIPSTVQRFKPLCLLTSNLTFNYPSFATTAYSISAISVNHSTIEWLIPRSSSCPYTWPTHPYY